MTNRKSFFTEEVPKLINELKPDTTPLWGTMNAAQMLDHLTAGTRLFMRQEEVEVTIPEDKIPLAQEWLKDNEHTESP